MKKKNIVILGSTGSIGTSALAGLDRERARYNIIALSAAENIEALAAQAKKYRPKYAAILNSDKEHLLKVKGVKTLSGEQSFSYLAALPDADIILISISGAAAIKPLLAAVRAGKRVALANKEALVMAGEIVNREVKEHGAEIIPVDSEHNAMFQAMQGHKAKDVKKLHITASGGPFKNYTQAMLKNITVEQALKHPTWKMGRKITIDSSTLMNKGLEVIEAHYLFNIAYEKIDVIIHPQSIVHSMVEYIDGSIIAQMSTPDMKLPIMYALAYPDRVKDAVAQLDLKKTGKLDFFPVDFKKFPAFSLALTAGKTGGTMPACMNAANEAAVKNFLNGKIKFVKIPYYIEKAMKAHRTVKNPDLLEILDADAEARERVEGWINSERGTRNSEKKAEGPLL
jgi:1-deoxy-D-xylulose-5-phosphate reductoisomerase